METNDDWEARLHEDEEFLWDPSLNLGHRTIDAEHRILHRLIVEFEELADKKNDMPILIRQFEKIMDYAKLHFASEEQIMQDYQYPGTSEHKQIHQNLLFEISNMNKECKLGKVESVHAYEFLLNWFSFHTSHEDKKLVSYLNTLSLHGPA